MPFDPSALGLKSSPEVARDIEQKVAESAKAAREAQEEADLLRYRATAAADDAEREALLAQSRAKDKEARAHSKEARRIASGAWQGTIGGAGIGGGVGAGLGTVVGTLVGTVAAIPLTGLGALIGLPVGLIHGPFFKTGDAAKAGEARKTPPSEEEQHQAVIQALDMVDGAESKEDK